MNEGVLRANWTQLYGFYLKYSIVRPLICTVLTVNFLLVVILLVVQVQVADE